VDEVEKGEGVHRPAGIIEQGRQKDYIKKHDKAEKPFRENLFPPVKEEEKEVTGGFENENRRNKNNGNGNLEVAVGDKDQQCLA
jgi:hypothetical protein